jgi:predicted RNA-binding Zn ribbon-like protein
MTSQGRLGVTPRYTAVVVLPAWVPEIETKPAPQPLLLVQSFVNTYEADTAVDLLAQPATARAWLQSAGLFEGGALTPELLEGLRDFRESVRALLVQNAGGDPPSTDQLASLRAATSHCRLAPWVSEAGVLELVSEEAGPAALGTLLLVIRDAQRDGTWNRLKACRNDECHWAFYDRSHAGRGAWCDMATCGNRIKNRNLRTRRSSARETDAARLP